MEDRVRVNSLLHAEHDNLMFTIENTDLDDMSDRDVRMMAETIFYVIKKNDERLKAAGYVRIDDIIRHGTRQSD